MHPSSPCRPTSDQGQVRSIGIQAAFVRAAVRPRTRARVAFGIQAAQAPSAPARWPRLGVAARRASLDAPRGVHHQPAAPVGWDALRGLRPCALLLTSTPARKVLSRSAGAGGPGQVSWTKSSDWQRSASWPPGAIYQGRLCAVRTVLPCQCPDEPCQASFGLSFRFDGQSRSGPRSRASSEKHTQQILAAKGRLDLFRAASPGAAQLARAIRSPLGKRASPFEGTTGGSSIRLEPA